jgi:hypothetical protein
MTGRYLCLLVTDEQTSGLVPGFHYDRLKPTQLGPLQGFGPLLQARQTSKVVENFGSRQFRKRSVMAVYGAGCPWAKFHGG